MNDQNYFDSTRLGSLLNPGLGYVGIPDHMPIPIPIPDHMGSGTKSRTPFYPTHWPTRARYEKHSSKAIPLLHISTWGAQPQPWSQSSAVGSQHSACICLLHLMLYRSPQFTPYNPGTVKHSLHSLDFTSRVCPS
jgi:hypothetical protein